MAEQGKVYVCDICGQEVQAVRARWCAGTSPCALRSEPVGEEPLPTPFHSSTK